MSEPEPQPPFQRQESETAWVPIGVGAAIVVVALVLIAFFSRPGQQQSAEVNPYASKLQISDLKMSAAENFVGGTVSYLEGKITNGGDKAVTSATLEVTFKNGLGELVQKETIPVRALAPHAVTGTAEMTDLSQVPLQPGKSIDFRLTFEHISGDWNHEYPQLRFVAVTTR